MKQIHLLAAACIALATAAAGPVDGFVIGKTTVADVEQGLGAPMDTVMQPDGALTLIYETARMPGSRTATAETRDGTTSLRFGTDFVLRDTIVASADFTIHNGFALK